MSAQKAPTKAPTAAPAPAAAPAAATPVVAPEAAPQKVRKERKERKPRMNVKVWTLYKVNEEAAERLRRECPRCGKGYFMGEHRDRLACGHCGFTQFKNK